MQYQEAVAEARRLDQVVEKAETTAEEAKWSRAKLAWEQVQAGVSASQWARDTGKSKRTINNWVRMWKRWGGDLGPQRPRFQEAWLIVQGRDNEIEEFGSHYAAGARTAVRNMAPEQQAEIVREALASLPAEHAAEIASTVISRPDVARRVVEDDAADVSLTRAKIAREHDRAERVDARGRAQAPQIRDTGELYGGLVDMDVAERRLVDAYAQFQRLGEPDSQRLAQVAERADAVQRALDVIREWVASSGRFDDEVRALLDEGGRSS